MIPRLLRPILAGLGFGASMVFVVAFISHGSSDAAASNEPVRVEPAPVAVAKPAAAALPDSDALIGEILERPVFSPSRQAVDATPPAEDVEEPKAPPKMPGRLAGLSIRPEAREALFEREGEKPVAVKEGQEIDGWVVSSIQSDHVVLRSASGEQILKPTDAENIRRPQVQAINRKPGAAPPKNPNAPAAAAVAGVRPPATPQPPAPPAQAPVQPNPRTGR